MLYRFWTELKAMSISFIKLENLYISGYSGIIVSSISKS